MGPMNYNAIPEDSPRWGMGCGECGGETFKVFKEKGNIIVKCTECGNESHITIKAEIVIDFDKGEGALAPIPDYKG